MPAVHAALRCASAPRWRSAHKRCCRGGVIAQDALHGASAGRFVIFKPVRPRIVAEHAGMRDQAARVPQVQLVAGGFENEALRAVGAQVQRNLVRAARAGGRQRAAKAALNGAVQMAAQQAFDLRVLAQQLFERAGAFQARCIHVRDAAGKGRVVHGDDGRARVFCKARAQPRQAPRAQLAVALPGHHGVKHQQPQRPQVQRVLQEFAALRKAAKVRAAKGAAQRSAARPS